MTDLIVATVILAAISSLALAAGYRIGALSQRWPSVAALIFVGVGYALYVVFMRDSVLLIQAIPFSSVPILGDPAPWLASLAAGVLLAQAKVVMFRRVAISSVVLMLGWYGPVKNLTVEPPPTQNSWHLGVCIQSTMSTCGPAAIATMLRRHGVHTNEATMAELCLTNHEGTHLTGMYRGLALKAPKGTEARATNMSIEELFDNPDRLPVIATLMLTRELANANPQYVEDWGWDVGVMHSVVVLGFETDEYVSIADPGVGPELWRRHGLAELWTGEVLYLERHD
jgi:predicted double-glycine peptidase